MHLHVYITVLVKPARSKKKRRKSGFSTVPPSLYRQIEGCSSLSELHTLFFSIGRKNRAVMNAFIDRREILEFNGRISTPHPSPKNNNNHHGSVQTPRP